MQSGIPLFNTYYEASYTLAVFFFTYINCYLKTIIFHILEYHAKDFSIFLCILRYDRAGLDYDIICTRPKDKNVLCTIAQLACTFDQLLIKQIKLRIKVCQSCVKKCHARCSAMVNIIIQHKVGY